MSVTVLADREWRRSGRPLYIPWPVGILTWLALITLTCSSLAKPLDHHDEQSFVNTEESLDGCNRVIWSSQEKRGVHQVQTRCMEGLISWQQPYGALRVTFGPPAAVPPTAIIETCFSVSSHLLKVMVSREQSAVEGGLEHLVMLNRELPRTQTDICVRTKRALTLFVEALPGDITASIGHVRLYYDVAVVRESQDDSLEECRPCTEEELLVKVCSNDFVVIGQMNAVRENRMLKQTTIDVAVDRVYRQKSEHFGSPTRLRRETSEVAGNSKNKHLGSVMAPHKCGIRKGAGRFLFLGRLRLGKAILQCAPRVEEFENVWRRAVQRGTNPCLLD